MVIEAVDKPKYIEALAKGDKDENYQELINLVKELSKKEMNRYINLFSQV